MGVCIDKTPSASPRLHDFCLLFFPSFRSRRCKFWALQGRPGKFLRQGGEEREVDMPRKERKSEQEKEREREKKNSCTELLGEDEGRTWFGNQTRLDTQGESRTRN
jgi:hypothetical protein